MTPEEKIEASQTRLILDHKWLAGLLVKLTVIFDESIETACTNGAWIRYSPSFVDTLPIEEVDGLMIHEILHAAMRHHMRMGSRDPDRWNVASDIVINHLIDEMGVRLPPDGLRAADFGLTYNGESEEVVYDRLSTFVRAPRWGFVFPGDCSPAQSREWREVLSTALQKARAAGVLPGSLGRMADELIAPPIPWRQLLAAHMSARATGEDDYTWSRCSRRGRFIGVYLPSLVGAMVRSAALIIDTSGSMGDEELGNAIAVVRGLADEMLAGQLIIISADAAVHDVTVLDKGDPLPRYQCKGGGGTDFAPALAEAARRQVSVAIYITDLAGSFPDPADAPPTIWLTQSALTAPFGVTIKLEATR